MFYCETEKEIASNNKAGKKGQFQYYPEISNSYATKSATNKTKKL